MPAPILIVEDDMDINRRFQVNVLSKEGCILRWEGVPWQGISRRDIGG